jgi:cytoskeletal protein RodZ
MKKNRVVLILILILFSILLFLVYENFSNEKNIDNNSVKVKNKSDEESYDTKEEIKDDTNEDETNTSTKEESTSSVPKTEAKENKTQNEAKNVNVSSIELIGDEEITINVGDKYTELGAKAYDTSGKDISSKINIDSSVDTSVSGTYTVSYSIGNYIVIRYVIVK